MVLKIISPDCGVQASLILLLHKIPLPCPHYCYMLVRANNLATTNSNIFINILVGTTVHKWTKVGVKSLKMKLNPNSLKLFKSKSFLFQKDLNPNPFLCQLTCQSTDIMSLLCGVYVCVSNFSSKTTMPRDMLFVSKDTLSIEDGKMFKACRSVGSSVC